MNILWHSVYSVIFCVLLKNISIKALEQEKNTNEENSNIFQRSPRFFGGTVEFELGIPYLLEKFASISFSKGPPNTSPSSMMCCTTSASTTPTTSTTTTTTTTTTAKPNKFNKPSFNFQGFKQQIRDKFNAAGQNVHGFKQQLRDKLKNKAQNLQGWRNNNPNGGGGNKRRKFGNLNRQQMNAQNLQQGNNKRFNRNKNRFNVKDNDANDHDQFEADYVDSNEDYREDENEDYQQPIVVNENRRQPNRGNNNRRKNINRRNNNNMNRPNANNNVNRRKANKRRNQQQLNNNNPNADNNVKRRNANKRRNEQQLKNKQRFNQNTPTIPAIQQTTNKTSRKPQRRKRPNSNVNNPTLLERTEVTHKVHSFSNHDDSKKIPEIKTSESISSDEPESFTEPVHKTAYIGNTVTVIYNLPDIKNNATGLDKTIFNNGNQKELSHILQLLYQIMDKDNQSLVYHYNSNSSADAPSERMGMLSDSVSDEKGSKDLFSDESKFENSKNYSEVQLDVSDAEDLKSSELISDDDYVNESIEQIGISSLEEVSRLNSEEEFSTEEEFSSEEDLVGTTEDVSTDETENRSDEIIIGESKEAIADIDDASDLKNPKFQSKEEIKPSKLPEEPVTEALQEESEAITDSTTPIEIENKDIEIENKDIQFHEDFFEFGGEEIRQEMNTTFTINYYVNGTSVENDSDYYIDSTSSMCEPEFEYGCSSESTENVEIKLPIKVPHPPIRRTRKCVCGRGIVNRHSIGNLSIEVTSFPWTVAITSSKIHLCGGTLITDQYVLTAAQCVVGLKARSIKVLAGMHAKRPHVDLHVSKIILHNEFNMLNLSNDIALLKLQHRYFPTERGRPVCLMKPGQEVSFKDDLLSSSWGKVDINEKEFQQFRISKVKLHKKEECEERYGFIRDNFIEAGHLCTEGVGPKVCGGGTGGSLLLEKNRNVYYQIGIVSWGVGCEKSGRPGIYTNVQAYLPWIEENVKDSKYCRS